MQLELQPRREGAALSSAEVQPALLVDRARAEAPRYAEVGGRWGEAEQAATDSVRIIPVLENPVSGSNFSAYVESIQPPPPFASPGRFPCHASDRGRGGGALRHAARRPGAAESRHVAAPVALPRAAARDPVG